MSLYTKTALKKMKKDEIIQMFLDLQAQKVNDSMDEENEKLKGDIVYLKHQKSVQREKLKEFMDEINKLKEENQIITGEFIKKKRENENLKKRLVKAGR